MVTCWFDQLAKYLEDLKTANPNDGIELLPVEDPAKFKAQLKTFMATDQGIRLKKDTILGFNSTDDLIFMKVLSVSLGEPRDPAKLKEPWYDKWETFMDEYRLDAPKSMKVVEQTATIWWAWMESEKAFITTAFQGMAIASFFCFIILLIANRNIIQSIIAIVCVALVIVSVLFIEYSLGWEIGVSESLAMVILIGFSVDYVVHLSSDYMHSAYTSRHDKMKQAYEEMGISILSGCCTTFGSGAFLFGGVLVTFQKFAILITCTVAISFIISMVLFGAIMHAIGPEKGFGDIDCCLKKKTIKVNQIDKKTQE